MAETGASEASSPDTDRDFDPTADMLVHDYDDEQTLEEEENMSGDSCSNELEDLEKEGDMPLTDLLGMYGYGNCGNEQQDTRSSSEEEILSNQDLTLDKDEIARDLLKNSDDDDDKETDVHDLINSVSHTARLLRSSSQPGSDEDDSDEEDYEPNEIPEDDWKKTIQVGHDFQASVPDGLCKYGDAPGRPYSVIKDVVAQLCDVLVEIHMDFPKVLFLPIQGLPLTYENEDRLLWDPDKLEDSVVENYLNEIHSQALQAATGVNAIPTGAHIRDDEQALYMLLQCGHNVEEALRRRKMQAIPPTDTMSLWSEEECRNFENGLRVYGKDFYLIQQNRVKTRSVGELVQFYYLWKKTERHDVFANKNRLEKRKYILHPGITDYMDRFDDQESPAPPANRERSASPVTCLLYNDPKRNSLKPSSDCNTPNATSESKEFDLNSASPTVTSLSPDLKRRSSSPKSLQHTNINGLHEEVSLESPVNKKLKKETDVSHYGLEESYSDSSHVDEKKSPSLTPGHHIADSITSSSLTTSESLI